MQMWTAILDSLVSVQSDTWVKTEIYVSEQLRNFFCCSLI